MFDRVLNTPRVILIAFLQLLLLLLLLLLLYALLIYTVVHDYNPDYNPDFGNMFNLTNKKTTGMFNIGLKSTGRHFDAV